MAQKPFEEDDKALGRLVGPNIQLDLDAEKVYFNKKPIHLSPKSTAVLALLMARSERLVTKDDLINQVWEGRAMSDAVVTTAMREIRSALKDKARSPKFIETVHGKGYRFLLKIDHQQPEPRVSVPFQRSGSNSAGEQTYANPPKTPQWVIIALALVVSLTALIVTLYNGDPDNTAPQQQIQSALAVLPFEERGNTGNADYFAETMHDGLISRLSGAGDLRVIARSSVLQFVQNGAADKAVWQELGASDVLEGSIQRTDDRVRVSVHLVDAVDHTTTWAATYDRELTSSNYFNIQADIIEHVSDALSNSLSGDQRNRLNIAPTTSLEANENYYRAKQIFDLQAMPGFLDAALLELDNALRLDPNFVSALALKAHIELAQYWYRGQSKDWVETAGRTLDRAEEISPNLPEVLISRGYYYYWGFRDYGKAREALDRALLLAPNKSGVWELSAYIARRQGRFQDTLTALEKARDLNPMDLELVTEWIETQAPLGPSERALELAKTYLQRHPKVYDLVNNVDRMWRLRGDAGEAYRVISGGVTGPTWGYYVRRMRSAILTRDPEIINRELAFIQTQSSGSATHFIQVKMFEIDAAQMIGDQNRVEILRSEISKRLQETRTTIVEGWNPNGIWTPVDLPSRLGDIAAVEAIVATYEEDQAPDLWQTVRHWSSIARAFARVGLNNKSLDYIERYVTLYGPSSVLRFEANAVYDSVRQTPRYKRLKAAIQKAPQQTAKM